MTTTKLPLVGRLKFLNEWSVSISTTLNWPFSPVRESGYCWPLRDWWPLCPAPPQSPSKIHLRKHPRTAAPAKRKVYVYTYISMLYMELSIIQMPLKPRYHCEQHHLWLPSQTVSFTCFFLLLIGDRREDLEREREGGRQTDRHHLYTYRHEWVSETLYRRISTRNISCSQRQVHTSTHSVAHHEHTTSK